jgi:hypothetical protein
LVMHRHVTSHSLASVRSIRFVSPPIFLSMALLRIWETLPSSLWHKHCTHVFTDEMCQLECIFKTYIFISYHALVFPGKAPRVWSSIENLLLIPWE